MLTNSALICSLPFDEQLGICECRHPHCYGFDEDKVVKKDGGKKIFTRPNWYTLARDNCDAVESVPDFQLDINLIAFKPKMKKSNNEALKIIKVSSYTEQNRTEKIN